MNVERSVRRFVEKVNCSNREPMPIKEVPPFLRDGESDGLFVDWKIVKTDNSADIALLESKLPNGLPPSFHHLVSNYCFPAFEIDDLMLFANTGGDSIWELHSRIFGDMSAVLLANGFLQIGHPFFYNYDPVCFDTNRGESEYPLVQLDHESVLISGEIDVVTEIAPSFVDFLSKVVGNVDA